MIKFVLQLIKSVFKFLATQYLSLHLLEFANGSVYIILYEVLSGANKRKNIRFIIIFFGKFIMYGGCILLLISFFGFVFALSPHILGLDHDRFMSE